MNNANVKLNSRYKKGVGLRVNSFLGCKSSH